MKDPYVQKVNVNAVVLVIVASFPLQTPLHQRACENVLFIEPVHNSGNSSSFLKVIDCKVVRHFWPSFPISTRMREKLNFVRSLI